MADLIDIRELDRKFQKSNNYYISFGKVIKLPVLDGIFLPSRAGVFFWETIYKNFGHDFVNYKSVLDLGCGSGFISIALAMSGCRNITGSDINSNHVAYAKEQFSRHETSRSNGKFICSDLFNDLGKEKYDFIAFNCPGWGTPTRRYINQFKDHSGQQYYSMFEGDAIATRSIKSGFDRLNAGGVFVIGLNSMGNIPSVIQSTKLLENKNMSMRSLGKMEFPLMLYNHQWKDKKNDLIDQFVEWSDKGHSYFRIEGDEIIWTYEIIALINTEKGGRHG